VMKRRKEVSLLVRVTVPASMTKAEAAREVRTLISDQCNYAADYDDVRVKACRSIEAPAVSKGKRY
jgi:hypothetical protein